MLYGLLKKVWLYWQLFNVPVTLKKAVDFFKVTLANSLFFSGKLNNPATVFHKHSALVER